jgi:glycosyltransferase involved in cell wall biosynthesis
MSEHLRVQYDAQIFERQVHGGISRYFSELLRASYASDGGIHADVGALFVKAVYVRQVSRRRLFPWPAAYSVAATAANRLYARARPADLVHSTYYDPDFLTRAVAKPHVVTVHDMIPEDYPEFFDKNSPHEAKEAYLRAADAIICVSEFTRSRLAAHVPGLDMPVHVIHEAATPLPPPAEGFDLAPDILYVGGRAGYKNFDALLLAMTLLKAESRYVRLLAVGGGPWTASEMERLRDLDLASQCDQRQLSDDQLHAAYRAAKVLVVPSFSEGFGLPVVEAMIAGCASLLSDAGSLPEIGSDAAEYFAPAHPEQLAASLGQLLGDKARRRRMVARARTRAEDFSWDKAYKRTADVYRHTARLRG